MLTDEQILNDVKTQFPSLEHLPPSELRKKVQEFAVSKELQERVPVGLEGIRDLVSNPRVQQTVCRAYHDHKIGSLCEVPHVASLAGILALFLTPGLGYVVLGITALAVLILREGVDRYCSGFAPGSATQSTP